jgi:1-acyl-sn-glycerol-3-phosphate acyltransferase
MLSHLLRLLGSDLGEVQIQLLTPIASTDLNRNALARAAQQSIREALFGATNTEPTADIQGQAA